MIAELTQGQPYRHVMGYELNEPGRAERDARYNTALRTGQYSLREWKWDRAGRRRSCARPLAWPNGSKAPAPTVFSSL